MRAHSRPAVVLAACVALAAPLAAQHSAPRLSFDVQAGFGESSGPAASGRTMVVTPMVVVATPLRRGERTRLLAVVDGGVARRAPWDDLLMVCPDILPQPASCRVARAERIARVGAGLAVERGAARGWTLRVAATAGAYSGSGRAVIGDRVTDSGAAFAGSVRAGIPLGSRAAMLFGVESVRVPSFAGRSLTTTMLTSGVRLAR